MKIIAIETATEICGVSIIENNEIIGIEEQILFRDHAEKLPLLTQKILKKYNLKIKDFNGVAVSTGPGSFTGLRIGLSFAKALAFSNDINLIPIPTLYSMVNNLDLKNAKVKILLYSHSHNIYIQDFQITDSYIKELTKPKLMNWDNEILLEKDFEIFHYGCEKFVNNKLIKPIKPSAKHIAETANQYYTKFFIEDFDNLQPNYVSAFKIG